MKRIKTFGKFTNESTEWYDYQGTGHSRQILARDNNFAESESISELEEKIEDWKQRLDTDFVNCHKEMLAYRQSLPKEILELSESFRKIWWDYVKYWHVKLQEFIKKVGEEEAKKLLNIDQNTTSPDKNNIQKNSSFYRGVHIPLKK